MMTAEDLLVVAAWLATIIFMIWVAWEPWRRTRHLVGLELPGDQGRVRSPLFVFGPAGVLAAAPFAAQLAPRPGVNAWLHPHLMMPMGAVFLAGFIAAQFGVRWQFLKFIERRRLELESRRAIFDQGSAKSTRRPSV